MFGTRPKALIFSEKKPEEEIPEKISTIQADFLDAFGRLAEQHDPTDIWNDFITMFACALAIPFEKKRDRKKETSYLQIIKKYDSGRQDLMSELTNKTSEALNADPNYDFLESTAAKLDIDISDSIRCLMVYVQQSLLGINASIKVGEDLWFTPMYYSVNK